MKIKKLGTAAVSALAVASIALAGCSGTDSAAGSAQAGGAAKDGYTLVEDGKLTVATSAEYEPFEYIEDGEYKGFDLELIQKVAEKLGLEAEFVNIDFDSVVPSVSSGTKADAGIAAITVTPERKKDVDFTDDYYMDDQAIVTMKDNADVTADTYKDALNTAEKTIIVQSGSTAESLAKETFPDATIKPFKNATECFSALQAGQGDALVTNRSVAAQMVANQFSDCQMIKQISTGENYAICVSKENSALTDKINDALAELKEDGTIDDLMAKYNV